MTKSDSVVRGHWRELAFGFLATLLSGFGQTYFVALFLVSVVSAIGISNGRFGLIYSISTLGAGLMLPAFGRWLDSRSERMAFLVAGLGMTVSLVILATAPSWWALLPALFGLRLCGPGAMCLISMTAMVRHFERRRGFALGFSSLGFPFAELVLPSSMLASITLIGWRPSLLVCGGVMLAFVVLIHFGLLANPLNGEASARQARNAVNGKMSRFRWWSDPFFLLLTATSIAMPIIGTVVLLYLVPISQSKEWPLDWLGAGFAAFAVVRALVSVLVGPMIDRFGGLRMYPFTLVPFCAAIAVLLLAASPWVGLAFFVLMGFGFGAGPVLTALLAEVYGRERIGEIRSLSASAMVLSSSVGPFATGIAIDYGWSFDAILTTLLITSIAALGGGLAIPNWGAKRKDW